MKKFFSIVVVAAAFHACKTNVPSSSSAKDIGEVNTTSAKTMVLYQDGSVYLKLCHPSTPPPLTRNCQSDAAPQSLELSAYLSKLYYFVGNYDRNENGLALATKAMDDARAALASGNQNASATVSSLEPIIANLKKILAIRDDLSSGQQDLTYYEYNDEYLKLLAPFGVSGSSSASGPDTITIAMIKCFSGTNSHRYVLDHAIRAENWPLAALEAKGLVDSLAVIGSSVPPRGELGSWQRLTTILVETVDRLNGAVGREDALSALKIMGALGKSCKGCHDQHK